MTSEITPEATPVDPSAVVAPAKKSKVRRNVLLASGAVGLVGIGSTLAANISLNGGNNVEFGQGVAKTTACDADGFTINPVTSYDNQQSIWRLDRVEVTGLNLTPVGTGYSSAGYSTQDEAKTAHPGEYYDNGWKRTCDGVVLDFKAYTDDINYWSYTRDGYYNGTNGNATPVGWAQLDGQDNNVGNFGFSVIFDTSDDNTGELTNWAVGDSDTYGYANMTYPQNLNHGDPTNSSFSFRSYNDRKPDSASISKIAVSSMATFPANYYVYDSGGIGRG